MVKSPIDREMDLERRLFAAQVREVEAGRLDLAKATAIPRGAKLVDGKVSIPTPDAILLAGAAVKGTALIALSGMLFLTAAFVMSLDYEGWKIGTLVVAAIICAGLGLAFHYLRDFRHLAIFAKLQITFSALSVVPTLISLGLSPLAIIPLGVAVYSTANGFEKLSKINKSDI